MLSQSNQIIASSRFCAESFKLLGNKKNINVIFVGVSLDRFINKSPLRNRYRKELSIKKKSIVILYMGRFNREMGLHNIIDIIPSLMKSHFHIILAGASGELVNQTFECKSLYPDKITIMNNISFDLQPSLYAASDIVLAPSRSSHACMGVSIKEAMAASVSVIASDSGGIPEAVLHNETGIIVPLQEDGENNVEGLKTAIIELSLNKKKRETFSVNSRKRASDLFSEEKTIEKTFELFKHHL